MFAVSFITLGDLHFIYFYAQNTTVSRQREIILFEDIKKSILMIRVKAEREKKLHKNINKTTNLLLTRQIMMQIYTVNLGFYRNINGFMDGNV